MKKRKKILLFINLLLFSICLCACINCQALAASSSSDILENDRLQVKMLNNYSELQITDKQTGTVWSSSMSDPEFDLSTVSVKWKEKMQSLFVLYVTNLEAGLGSVNVYNQTGMDYAVETYAVEDGIGVLYDIPNLEMNFCMEFGLTESGIKIRIPNEKIVENGDFSLVSIDLMPFFCGAVDGQKGYFFYPDGSGGIMRFDDPEHVSEMAVTYNVYGTVEKNQNILGFFEENEPQVMLPVYGANFGSEGFVAYVTEGEENAKITVTPSGDIVKANFIYPSFIYRRFFQDLRITSKPIVKYDDERLTTSYELRIDILQKDHAEYADMAVAYRKYLFTNDALAKREVFRYPQLALDLFMGIKEEGLIFDTLQKATTFAQAQEILEELDSEIEGEISTTLLGWTAEGYRTQPKYFPVNRKLGGSKGLKELMKYAEENDVSISLGADFLMATADATGYSERKDVVYLGNYQLLTDAFSSVRVLSPNVAEKLFDKFVKKAAKYSPAGIKLEKVGEMLYYNYGEENTVSISECKDYWKSMIQSVKTNFGTAICEGGNLYTLSAADRVTGIPDCDYGYRMTTASVPFYQIVAHGYVDYTGTAMNLGSDLEYMLLKWIEYGYVPYFELTYESSEILMDTDYNQLFTSEYAEWKDEVVKVYETIREALQEVHNEAIVSHEEVGKNVFCTGYENGIRIYVNYNAEVVSVDGVSVDALNYTVVGGK